MSGFVRKVKISPQFCEKACCKALKNYFGIQQISMDDLHDLAARVVIKFSPAVRE